MTPLKLNQFVLTLIGVCAEKKTAPITKKIVNLFVYALLIVMTTINTTATTLYFVLYVSTDYDGAIYGLLAATVLISMIYMLITLRIHSKKLRSIFSTLDVIYRECKICRKIFKNKNEINLKIYSQIVSHCPQSLDGNTKPFSESSYANQIAKKVSFLFIIFYPPGFFIMSVIATSVDVLRCYFRDGLTDVGCLFRPYRYV